jgi:hypothetical protein
MKSFEIVGVGVHEAGNEQNYSVMWLTRADAAGQVIAPRMKTAVVSFASRVVDVKKTKQARRELKVYKLNRRAMLQEPEVRSVPSGRSYRLRTRRRRQHG